MNCRLLLSTISGHYRRWFNPYLLVLSLVCLILYTLQSVMVTEEVHYEPDAMAYIRHNSYLDEKSFIFANKTLLQDRRLARKALNVYNLTSGYVADFDCVEMRTSPPTPVCVYPTWSDMYISHDLIETGLWEPHVLFDFQTALQRDNSLGVLDIGANIGVYSLLAAKMGRKVIAVEPLHDNIMRLHYAAVRAGTEALITVLQNAVSDERIVGTIRTNGNNKGDTRVEHGYRPCIGSCPQKIRTILLSDLRYVLTFDRAIMKMDIQGYEARAFVNINGLLDAITVPYIYMEWILMRNTVEPAIQVKGLMKGLYERDYRPYSLSSGGSVKLLANDWRHWPFDIVWCHLPSMLEYSRLMKNHFFLWP